MARYKNVSSVIKSDHSLLEINIQGQGWKKEKEETALEWRKNNEIPEQSKEWGFCGNRRHKGGGGRTQSSVNEAIERYSYYSRERGEMTGLIGNVGIEEFEKNIKRLEKKQSG